MAKPGLVDRMKERKRLVEDESTLDEGEGLIRANKKMQEYEGSMDREAMRPVRKTEAGKYEGMNMPDMMGTDEDGPPRKKYMKKRTY